MLTEKMKKSLFLERFLTLYPSYPHRMRATLHSYDDDNLNPYHLEDDCWSHTMMVFNSIQINNHSETLQNAMMLAALCHDAGKPLQRKTHAPGKINFWNHPEAGTQFTAEACYALFGNTPEFNRILHLSTFAVGHHITGYDIHDNHVSAFFCGDIDFYTVLVCLLKADLAGQFTNTENNILKDQNHFSRMALNMVAYKMPERTPKVVVYCGIPGSGKDTIAEQQGYHILSYDKIRIELYLEKNPTAVGDPDLYTKAFEFAKKTNLDTYLEIKIRELLKCDGTIAICNTNGIPKSRKKIVSLCKFIDPDLIVHCVHVFTPLNVAIKNDATRSSKTVGKRVVLNFAHKQKVATWDEKFDKVEVVFNTYGVE